MNCRCQRHGLVSTLISSTRAALPLPLPLLLLLILLAFFYHDIAPALRGLPLYFVIVCVCRYVLSFFLVLLSVSPWNFFPSSFPFFLSLLNVSFTRSFVVHFVSCFLRLLGVSFFLSSSLSFSLSILFVSPWCFFYSSVRSFFLSRLSVFPWRLRISSVAAPAGPGRIQRFAKPKFCILQFFRPLFVDYDLFVDYYFIDCDLSCW